LYYTIYKTTNNINHKTYIGKHQTKDINDEYYGSGKHLKHAIKKYGIETFCKEILFLFDTEEEMNAKEEELVTEEYCLRKDTYNLCVGGRGGFSYINREGLRPQRTPELNKKVSDKLRGRKNPKASETLRKRHKAGVVKYDTFTGKKHTESTKELIRQKAKINSKGEKNSSWGKIFVTDGMINKKITEQLFICEYEPIGFRRGRTDKRK